MKENMTEEDRASTANKLEVLVLEPSTYPGQSAGHAASKDGCRIRCILWRCRPGQGQQKGPVGHTSLAGWGLKGQVCPGGGRT